MSFKEVWVTKLPEADLRRSLVPIQPSEMRTNRSCISSDRVPFSFNWEVVCVAVEMMISRGPLKKLSSR